MRDECPLTTCLHRILIQSSCTNWAVVVVIKWSACFPSILKIRIQISLLEKNKKSKEETLNDTF